MRIDNAQGAMAGSEIGNAPAPGMKTERPAMECMRKIACLHFKPCAVNGEAPVPDAIGAATDHAPKNSEWLR